MNVFTVLQICSILNLAPYQTVANSDHRTFVNFCVKPDIPSWVLKDDRKSRSLEPNIPKFNGVRFIVIMFEIFNVFKLCAYIQSIH